MKQSLIQLVQKCLRSRNFTISRPPLPTKRPLNMLALAAAALQKTPDSEVRLVQIGANDGVSNDPVRDLLKRHHWQSLLVEPIPEVHERLRSNYADMPHVTTDCCALARSDGPVTLFRVSEEAGLPDSVSRLASFDRGMLEKQEKHFPGIRSHIRSIDVPGKTFKTLLVDHGIDHVDLLQVDTEGFDHEVVRMAIEAGCQPSVINFESWHIEPAEKDACAKLLEESGYSHSTVGRDTLAIKADLNSMTQS